jgi:hypothetical protein
MKYILILLLVASCLSILNAQAFTYKYKQEFVRDSSGRYYYNGLQEECGEIILDAILLRLEIAPDGSRPIYYDLTRSQINKYGNGLMESEKDNFTLTPNTFTVYEDNTTTIYRLDYQN